MLFCVLKNFRVHCDRYGPIISIARGRVPTHQAACRIYCFVCFDDFVSYNQDDDIGKVCLCHLYVHYMFIMQYRDKLIYYIVQLTKLFSKITDSVSESFRELPKLADISVHSFSLAYIFVNLARHWYRM